MLTTKLSRIHLFVFLLLVVYSTWLGYFLLNDQWHLFESNWPMSLTMVLGSFVAGSSAIGGGGVAYPVFTKVLYIQPEDARTFSLMIQTVGMGMASVFIWVKRIKVLWNVVWIASAGGLLGLLMGTFGLIMPTPYQKLTLTYVMSMFGVLLVYLTWGNPLKVMESINCHNLRKALLLFGTGILGGILSANVGSGIDILVFIVLTLAFGIHEKIGTPTSVIIMAINAAAGFLLHAWSIHDISARVFEFWLVCVPVVAVGAPLGAWIISMAKRHHIIIFLLSLISLELLSTLLLVPQNHRSLLFSASLLTFLSGTFWLMLKYRVQAVQNCGSVFPQTSS